MLSNFTSRVVLHRSWPRFLLLRRNTISTWRLRLSVPEFGTKVSHLVTLKNIRPEAGWSVAHRSLTQGSKKWTSVERGAFVHTSLANPNPSNPRHGLSTCIDHSINSRTTENTPQVPKLNPLTLFSLLSFTLDRLRHNAEQDQGEKARQNTHTHTHSVVQ